MGLGATRWVGRVAVVAGEGWADSGQKQKRFPSRGHSRLGPEGTSGEEAKEVNARGGTPRKGQETAVWILTESGGRGFQSEVSAE